MQIFYQIYYTSISNTCCRHRIISSPTLSFLHPTPRMDQRAFCINICGHIYSSLPGRLGSLTQWKKSAQRPGGDKFRNVFHSHRLHGLTFTWWGCCGLCLWHKATELAQSFLFCSCVCFCLRGPFNCISFHKLSRQLSAFSLCSPNLISALLALSAIYLSMKVSLSLDWA